MPILSKLLLNPKSRLIFALCAGLLLTSTAPYIGLGIYAWVALVPLFLLIRTSTSYKAASLEALVFLLSYNLSFFIWILGVHPLTWLHIGNTESLIVTFLIWFLTALFHSVVLSPVILLTKFLFLKNKVNELSMIYIILIALAWVLTTHTLTLNLEPNLASIAIPLNELAYSQYQYKEIIQCCNIIGAIGLEFLIVLVNLVLLNLLDTNLKINRKNLTKYLTIIIILFVVLLSYGKSEIEQAKKQRSENSSKLKSFAIVQANYSQASKEVNTTDPLATIKYQHQLSGQVQNRVDFLFWAEGSVRVVNKSKLQVTLFRDLVSKANVFVYSTPMIITGHNYTVIDFMEYNYTGNVATGFNLQHYYKSRLMPFGEYTPFYNWLPANLQQISDNTIGENFISSSPNQPLLINKIKIASTLCSELMFPQILRKQVREGAELMLNLNDLSWYRSPLNIFRSTRPNTYDQPGEDMVKKLFFAVAVFRAVENHRDLILSSNTGYSALINHAGEVLVLSGANRPAILQNSFLPTAEKSIYTFYSW